MLYEMSTTTQPQTGDKPSSFLEQKYGVDERTVGRVRHTNTKQFLMDIPRPGEQGSGMCLASGSWLEFCGFQQHEVLGKTPAELIQGPLTSSSHKNEMREFFSSFDVDKEMLQQEPSRLVINDLVNYRRVHKKPRAGASDSFTIAPFKFTLTIQLLKSEVTGHHFRIWEAIMSDESDLTAEQIASLTAERKGPSPGTRKRTLQRKLKTPATTGPSAGRSTTVVEACTSSESALALALATSSQPVLKHAWSRLGEFVPGLHSSETCFSCGKGASAEATNQQLLECMEQQGAHFTNTLSQWSTDGTVYIHHAPVHFTLVLCKVQTKPSSPSQDTCPYLATLTRRSGDVVAFFEFCAKVKDAYDSELSLSPLRLAEHTQRSAVPQGNSSASAMNVDIDIDCIMEMSNWNADSMLPSSLASTSTTDSLNSGSASDGSADEADIEDFQLAHGQCQPHGQPQSQTQSQSQSDTDQQQMMEAYVCMVDSVFVHPAMRLEAACHLAELCDQSHANRELFLRVGVDEGFAPGEVLRTMFTDVDPQLHRCAVAILLQLVRGARGTTGTGTGTTRGDGESMGVKARQCHVDPAVRSLCMQYLSDVQSVKSQAEADRLHNNVNSETGRLASQLLPLMRALTVIE